jgi:hypothetical protein
MIGQHSGLHKKAYLSDGSLQPRATQISHSESKPLRVRAVFVMLSKPIRFRLEDQRNG